MTKPEPSSESMSNDERSPNAVNGVRAFCFSADFRCYLDRIYRIVRLPSEGAVLKRRFQLPFSKSWNPVKKDHCLFSAPCHLPDEIQITN